MKRLLTLALLLACIVVPLGAYVRLSDAGLGCPDWPGCYGQATPLQATVLIDAAMQQQPDGPVSHAKAWKEMIHRYLAAILGVLVFLLCVMAWREQRQRILASALLLLLLVQGLLGMWTVTLLLKPAVVSAHLLGGMSIVAMLALWRFSISPRIALSPGHVRLVWLLPVLVLLQMALGGWISSNYAALACQGFPLCNGAWWPSGLQFEGAFHWQRALGESSDGTPLQLGQLQAIHWLHRLGALAVSLFVVWLVWRGWRYAALRPRLLWLLAALFLQLLLGAANVWWQLPLSLAVGHNIGAMLLLALSVHLAGSVRSCAEPGERLLVGVLQEHRHANH